MSQIVKIWTTNLILLVIAIFCSYDENDEFYWFYIQFLNNKLTLLISGSFAIVSYFFSIYCVQRIFIGDSIMEAERLVSFFQV